MDWPCLIFLLSGPAAKRRGRDIEKRFVSQIASSSSGVRILHPSDNPVVETSSEEFARLQKMRQFDLEHNRGARDPNGIGEQVIPVDEGPDLPMATALAVDSATLLPEDSIGMAYPVPEEWVSAVPTAWTVLDAADPRAKLRKEALKRRLITRLEAEVMEAAVREQNGPFKAHSRVLESRMIRAVRGKKKRKQLFANLTEKERVSCVIADAMRYSIMSELVSGG